jgi:hypothetical protein
MILLRLGGGFIVAAVVFASRLVFNPLGIARRRMSAGEDNRWRKS